MLCSLEEIFNDKNKSLVVSTVNGQRKQFNLEEHISVLVDEFASEKSCGFIRATGSSKQTLKIETDARCCEKIPAGGWLLSSNDKQAPIYWVPRLPTLRKLDSHGRILSERFAPVSMIDSRATKIIIALVVPDDEVLDMVVWRFGSDIENIIRELKAFSPIENQGWFLWGSHSLYGKPSDIYTHLIHGHVYESRFAWPNYRKICSENDAHSLYVILKGLQRDTGKQLYQLFLFQLVCSVIHRQDSFGAWRHGEWSETLECHTRLHCSGMHLLMDSLTEGYDSEVEKSLNLAADFISKQHDHVDGDVWFLHDELESSMETMEKTFFKCLPSKVMGKKKSNMLVLNTHLDTTIALGRYHRVTKNTQYIEIVKSARKAAEKILKLSPFSMLYSILFFSIKLTLLPTETAKKLPLITRAFKRIGWKYILPNWAKIKTCFPRLVMPSGYIERHLSITGLADEYHSINLMDLARYSHMFTDSDYVDVIENGIRFGFDIDVINRWLEFDNKKYAVGFWGEALYHWYLKSPSFELIDRISSTVFVLYDNKIGLPPSFLGGNFEVISQMSKETFVLQNNPNLVIVNFSRNDHLELIVINVGDEFCQLVWDKGPSKKIIWHSPSDKKPILENQPRLEARSWLLGKSN